jgi:hypothetical protein
MPRSARFKELESRLRELRKNMLPATFSPTGSYSARQLDRSRGYRLLVHAEIEAFLEDVTFETARLGVSEWARTKKVSNCLFCLVASYHAGFFVEGLDEEPPFLSEQRTKLKDSVQDLVENALKQYRHIHATNHGIKEENLFRLVLPVGVRKDELDALWITNLNEFGKRRGDIAHKAVKAHQQIDPSSELQDVQSLLAGLKKLDELLAKLS